MGLTDCCGIVGPPGYKGPKGNIGATGTTGPTGATGVTGPARQLSNCINLKYVGSTSGAKGNIVKLIPPTLGNEAYVTKPSSIAKFEWASRIAGTLNDIGTGISVDCNGNGYITGYYNSSPLNFYNPNGATGTTVLGNSGSIDTFISKFDTLGNFQWASRIAGTSSVQGTLISVDCNSNSYVTGYYSGSPLNFYNPNGTTGTTALSNSGSIDIFITKLNTSGVFQWASRIAGTSFELGNAISVDCNGNSYVTGSFDSASLNFYNPDGTTGATALSNSGSIDIFIAKLDTQGYFQWASRIASTLTDVGNGISVDCSGNSYITGYYSGSPLNFYNPNGTTGITPLGNSGSNDIFIAKLNTLGVFQWASRIGGTGSDIGTAINVDCSGNSYVTGYYNSTSLNFYNSNGTTGITPLTISGQNDIFIAKINTAGLFQWASRIAGTSTDQGNAISVDCTGNSYVTGFYSSSSLDFYNQDRTIGITSLSNSGSNDIFIAKLDTTGNFKWASRIAGTSSDIGTAISVDSNGNSYISGYYQNNSIDFYNSDGATGINPLVNSGSNDVFIAKLLNNDDKCFKPRAILQGPVNNNENIDVCFIDGVLTPGFTGSTPASNYFISNSFEYGTCWKCKNFLGTAVTDTQILTDFTKCNCPC